MSDPTLPPVDLEKMDEDERRDKIRNRIIIALIALIGFAVAGWVGNIVAANQDEAKTSQAQTEAAQVEKFNLAQQISAACRDQDSELDADIAQRLCQDAATIVREGPEGAQGVPGVQGVQGVPGLQGPMGLTGAQGVRGPPGVTGTAGTPGEPGTNGVDGQPGAQGPAGPAGKDGEDGAVGPVGPAGEAGKDGEPPVGWVVYGPGDTVVETCTRADPFDAQDPRYTCTRPSLLP